MTIDCRGFASAVKAVRRKGSVPPVIGVEGLAFNSKALTLAILGG